MHHINKIIYGGNLKKLKLKMRQTAFIMYQKRDIEKIGWGHENKLLFSKINCTHEK